MEPIWSLEEEPPPDQHLGASQTFFSRVALGSAEEEKGASRFRTLLWSI